MLCNSRYPDSPPDSSSEPYSPPNGSTATSLDTRNTAAGNHSLTYLLTYEIMVPRYGGIHGNTAVTVAVLVSVNFDAEVSNVRQFTSSIRVYTWRVYNDENKRLGVAEGPSLSDTLDWRSLEMTPFDRTHVLLLTFNSNYGFILHCFSIFHFEEHCDFEIRVRGHSRSSKVLPFW